MIVLDENKLSNETIAMIGRDYGMVENGDSIAEYVKHIDNVI